MISKTCEGLFPSSHPVGLGVMVILYRLPELCLAILFFYILLLEKHLIEKSVKRCWLH